MWITPLHWLQLFMLSTNSSGPIRGSGVGEILLNLHLHVDPLEKILDPRVDIVFFFQFLSTNPYVACLPLLSSIWIRRIQTDGKHYTTAFCLKAKLNAIHGRQGGGGGLLSGNRKYLVILHYTVVNFETSACVKSSGCFAIKYLCLN